MMTTGNELIICGTTIREDVTGNLNLTDIWHAAGSPSTKKPANWRQSNTTDEYCEAVARNIGKSYIRGKNDATSVIYTKLGNRGGTFGHILVAIAYGEYLRPDLAVEIKTTYLRVRSGDLKLVDEILERAEAARHHNEARDISIQVRKKYADTLTAHRAGGAIGYCTDAIYEVLLGGTAKQIIVSRNLPAKTNVRNVISTGELLKTINTEYLSAERIDGLNICGREPCAEASRQVARFVNDAFEKAKTDERLE